MAAQTQLTHRRAPVIASVTGAASGGVRALPDLSNR
jgi:hypothetical protein